MDHTSIEEKNGLISTSLNESEEALSQNLKIWKVWAAWCSTVPGITGDRLQ